MGRPLKYWEQLLKVQPEAQKRKLKASQFYRESKIAVKSGLFDKYWELPVHYKAWVIATLEEMELLQEAVEHVSRQESKKNEVAVASRHGAKR